jgi:hypothetical protein
MNRQQSLLLTALKSGRRLTFLEAASDPAIGVAALSQRVGELRRMGYAIEDEWVETPAGARIKKYFMREQFELVA